MSEPVYFVTLGLVLGTILVVFGMRYAAAYSQARARLADEATHRDLAAGAVAGQAETAVAISAVHSTLVDVEKRLAAIETVLKEVE